MGLGGRFAGQGDPQAHPHPRHGRGEGRGDAWARPQHSEGEAGQPLRVGRSRSAAKLLLRLWEVAGFAGGRDSSPPSSWKPSARKPVTGEGDAKTQTRPSGTAAAIPSRCPVRPLQPHVPVLSQPSPPGCGGSPPWLSQHRHPRVGDSLVAAARFPSLRRGKSPALSRNNRRQEEKEKKNSCCNTGISQGQTQLRSLLAPRSLPRLSHGIRHGGDGFGKRGLGRIRDPNPGRSTGPRCREEPDADTVVACLCSHGASMGTRGHTHTHSPHTHTL